MKVAHVIAEFGQTGGAEAAVESIIRDQLARGWCVVLVSQGGSRVESVTAAGARVVYAPLAVRSPLASVRSIVKLRTCNEADLVHAHNLRAAFLVRVALGRARPKLVATQHGTAPRRRRLADWLLPRLADIVAAVDPGTAERIGAKAMRKVRLIYLGVPAASPVESRVDVRTQLDLADDDVVFICVARLARQKRHDVLLRAFARVGRAKCKLVIVGSGPLEASTRQLAVDVGVARHVRFLGTRTDVADLLAAADCFILTSYWEGLPFALLEAMNHGLPVIASDVDGMRAWLERRVVRWSRRKMSAGLRPRCAERQRMSDGAKP